MPKGGDDLGGIVHRQRGLGHERHFGVGGQIQGCCIGQRFHQMYGTRGQLAQGPLDLRVPAVADQYYRAASLVVLIRFPVDLGDQGAGGVHLDQASAGGFRRNRFCNPVGRKYHRSVCRHLV